MSDSYSSQVVKRFASIVVGGAALETPVVEGASIANVATVTTVGTNSGTSAAGLSLVGPTDTVDQATVIMRDFKSLQEDIVALKTTVDSILGALRDHNIIAPLP